MAAAITSVVCQSTTMPSCASLAAGMTRSRHGSRPKRSCAAAMPAGWVGATTALAPTLLSLPFTIGQPNRLPSSRLSVSTNAAGSSALGERAPKSMPVTLPVANS